MLLLLLRGLCLSVLFVVFVPLVGWLVVPLLVGAKLWRKAKVRGWVNAVTRVPSAHPKRT